MNYQKMKETMVQEGLIAQGITDPTVIGAFYAVDRHHFVREKDVMLAYDDYPLDIGLGQTISQPFIVALMIQEARLKRGDKVLEIGTGSGYQTAILKEIVDQLYTIERLEDLYILAKTRLTALGYQNITYIHGDGTEGAKDYAPFQAIIVSAAAKTVPPKLLEQLDQGGRLIIPVGNLFYQDLLKITRVGSTFKRENLGGCRFVRLIPNND